MVATELAPSSPCPAASSNCTYQRTRSSMACRHVRRVDLRFLDNSQDLIVCIQPQRSSHSPMELRPIYGPSFQSKNQWIQAGASMSGCAKDNHALESAVRDLAHSNRQSNRDVHRVTIHRPTGSSTKGSFKLWIELQSFLGGWKRELQYRLCVMCLCGAVGTSTHRQRQFLDCAGEGNASRLTLIWLV